MFLLRSDKNSGCYGNLKFPLTCMEKKWKLAFSVVRLGIFEFFFLHKCLLSSPPRLRQLL